MPAFEPFTVVSVPFPYVEREARKRRPALVVSTPALADVHGLLWVLMITSAANRAWAQDVAITDVVAAGLPKPSVVRVAKIATVEAQRCVGIGQLARQPAEMVTARLQAILAPVADHDGRTAS